MGANRGAFAATRARIVGDYRHPRWLLVSGAIIASAMAAAGAHVLLRDIPTLMR